MVTMPRANRHYIPGCIWHITHRCHKKEFLLRFHVDRRCWLRWLFEAKKRFGLSILNYTVTSNHIHLLVRDTGDKDVIPKSIQLVAGRTGQAFNARKRRKGAFWEDRYHATAIETGQHLIQCLVYIDLNMVRAGVVNHPSQWPFGGYNEILSPKQRYALIDYDGLMDLLNYQSMEELSTAYESWMNASVDKVIGSREDKWTQSIAVGSKPFVEDTRRLLGINGRGRKVRERDGSFELREPPVAYNPVFVPENVGLSTQNRYGWKAFY